MGRPTTRSGGRLSQGDTDFRPFGSRIGPYQNLGRVVVCYFCVAASSEDWPGLGMVAIPFGDKQKLFSNSGSAPATLSCLQYTSSGYFDFARRARASAVIFGTMKIRRLSWPSPGSKTIANQSN